MKKLIAGMKFEMREKKKDPVLLRVKLGKVVEHSDRKYMVESNGQYRRLP